MKLSRKEQVWLHAELEIRERASLSEEFSRHELLESQSEQQRPKRDDRFLRGGQITFMIYEHFRVTSTHVAILVYRDLFSISLHDDVVQRFDTRWEEV